MNAKKMVRFPLAAIAVSFIVLLLSGSAQAAVYHVPGPIGTFLAGVWTSWVYADNTNPFAVNVTASSWTQAGLVLFAPQVCQLPGQVNGGGSWQGDIVDWPVGAPWPGFGPARFTFTEDFGIYIAVMDVGGGLPSQMMQLRCYSEMNNDQGAEWFGPSYNVTPGVVETITYASNPTNANLEVQYSYWDNNGNFNMGGAVTIPARGMVVDLNFANNVPNPPAQPLGSFSITDLVLGSNFHVNTIIEMANPPISGLGLQMYYNPVVIP